MFAINILLLSVQFETCNCVEFKIISDELEKQLRKMGYGVSHRRKKMTVNNKEYEIVRSIIRNPSTGQSVILTPDTMSVHRPYPSYVYLFSVVIYELQPGLSMGGAARITGKLFGIPKFSKSTVCRARERLMACASAMLEAAADTDEGNGRVSDGISVDEEICHKVCVALKSKSEPTCGPFPPSGASLSQAFYAIPWTACAIVDFSASTTKSLQKDFADAVGDFVRRFFKLYRRLLI